MSQRSAAPNLSEWCKIISPAIDSMAWDLSKDYIDSIIVELCGEYGRINHNGAPNGRDYQS